MDSITHKMGIELIALLVTGGVSLVSLIISLIVSLHFYNKGEKNYDAKLRKDHHVYENKVKVIKDALYSIDSYLSYLVDDGRPIIREKMTDVDLTLMVRKNYNSLALCCSGVEIVDLYLTLFLSNLEDGVLKKYNEFRNLCRNELGLKDQLKFDENRIFHTIISTIALKKYSEALRTDASS